MGLELVKAGSLLKYNEVNIVLENLSMFGFRALWSPWFFLCLVGIAVLYFMLIKNPTNKQRVLFITSLVSLYIVKGSPIDLLGHLNFSIHMLQMSVLYLILPPLFLLSIPGEHYRQLLSMKAFSRPFLFLTKPLFAVLLFNGVFSIYHYPIIFDGIKTNTILHASVTIFIFITALIMWWPLVCPLPEYRKLSGLQKLAYIFADGMLLTPACALIIFSGVPIYETYTNPAAWAKALELCVPASMLANIDINSVQMFSWLSPYDDQQLGGVIMKIMQEISYGYTLGAVFFQWVREEKRKEQKQQTAIFPTPQPLK